ncbi:hypothetical protein CYMTET_23840, partial [Cymbomonas tetramitiformis]
MVELLNLRRPVRCPESMGVDEGILQELESLHWDLLHETVEEHGFPTLFKVLGRALQKLGEAAEKKQQQSEPKKPSPPTPVKQSTPEPQKKEKKSDSPSQLSRSSPSSLSRSSSSPITKEVSTPPPPKKVVRIERPNEPDGGLWVKKSVSPPAKPSATPEPAKAGSSNTSLNRVLAAGKSPGSPEQQQWRKASIDGMSIDLSQGPFASGEIDKLSIEPAVRHMFNPHTKEWTTDDVQVKLATAHFAVGGMRRVYGMQENLAAQPWDNKRAIRLVGKRYIDEEPRETYFTDIKLQMAAK